MSAPAPARPAAGEYAPFYENYVALVPEGDVVETLSRQAGVTLGLLAAVTDEQAGRAYEPGKWSLKEVVGHMIDTERVFAYRALRFSRGDGTPLPGFEQDDYVRGGDFNTRALADLRAELTAVREATLSLLRHLPPGAWERTGEASGHPVSVRAIAHIIAGHELHHVNVIRSKYLR